MAAAAAYINARFQVSYDLHMLKSILPTVSRSTWWKLRGRLNTFYRLEALATSKSSENRLFLRFEDKTYTYAQAYDTVLRYSSWLIEYHGVKRGELVALDFQNTDTLIFLLFAVWSLGAIPALINYNLTGNALVHCIRRSGARLVLVDPTVADHVGEDVRSQLTDVNFEVVTPALELQMLGCEPIRPPDALREDVMPDDMGALVFTSGTTGLPKAAIVSWAKIVVVGGFTSGFIGTRSSDVYYTVSRPLEASLGDALMLSLGHASVPQHCIADGPLQRAFSGRHVCPVPEVLDHPLLGGRPKTRG